MAAKPPRPRPRPSKTSASPGTVRPLGPPPPAGAYSHIELYSNDAPATERFYETVFGWRIQDLSHGPGMTYRTYATPREPSGGILPRREGPFQPPSVLTYVQTEDVDATLQKIQRAGGKILVPKYEIPNVGAFVIFEAPGGIVQAAWQNRQPRASATSRQARV